jgi:hypothetical protein
VPSNPYPPRPPLHRPPLIARRIRAARAIHLPCDYCSRIGRLRSERRGAAGGGERRAWRGASEWRWMECMAAARGVCVRVQMGQPQGAATDDEEAKGIRMGDFFNKLMDRASSGVKAQATRRWACGSVRRFARIGRKTRSITINNMRWLKILEFNLQGTANIQERSLTRTRARIDYIYKFTAN